MPSRMRELWTSTGDLLFGYDFFVSYAHDDGKEYPRRLTVGLAPRFRVCLDQNEYQPGEDLPAVTRRRVRRSRVLLVVVGPAALQSWWVKREIEESFSARRTVIAIDVRDPALAADDGEVARLLANRIHIQDPAGGAASTPSPTTIEKLKAAFTFWRQGPIRRAALAGAVALVIALGGAALWQTRSAREQRALAELGREIADARRLLHDSSLLRAEASVVPPDNAAALIRRSLRLVIDGGRRLAERGDPLPLERNQLLREAAHRTPRSVREMAFGGEVTDLKYASIGEALLVVTTGPDGETSRVVRDGAAGSAIPAQPRLFSDDLSVLGDITEDNEWQLWRTDSGQQIAPGREALADTTTFLSPLGRYLATISPADALVVSEVAGGAVRLRAPARMPVVFSRDEQAIAYAGTDDTIRVAALDGSAAQCIPPLPRYVHSLAFSPDRRILAMASSCDIVLWSLDPPGSLRTIATPAECGDPDDDAIGAVAFSDDGSRLTTLLRRSAAAYDVASGRRLWPLRAAYDKVFDWSYDGESDGGRVVMRWRSSVLEVTDATTGNVRIRLPLSREPGTASYSREGDTLAVADGKTVRIFDLGGGDATRDDPLPEGVTGTLCSDDATTYAFLAGSGITVWSSEHGTMLGPLKVPESADLALSNAGNAMAHTVEGGVAVVTFDRWGHPRSAFLPIGRADAVALSSRAAYMEVTAENDTRIIETATGKVLSRFADVRVATSPDEKQLAVFVPASPPRLMMATIAGRTLATIPLPRDLSADAAIAFSPGGKYVVIVAPKRYVIVDAVAGRVAAVPIARVSPGDYELYIAGGDGFAVVMRRNNVIGAPTPNAVRVWDLRKGEITAEIPFDDAPTALAFDEARGRMAVSAPRGESNELHVIDMRDGKEVRAIAVAETVSRLAFSADGRHLASGGDIGLLRIRAVDESDESRMEVARIQHAGRIESIAFLDSDRIVVMTRSGAETARARVWRWSSDALLRHLVAYRNRLGS